MDGVDCELNGISYIVKTFHVCDSICDLDKLYHSHEP